MASRAINFSRVSVMKAAWLKEIQELLDRPDFRRWWEELNNLRDRLKQASGHLDDLLTQEHISRFRAELAQKEAIDTLYLAGEYEAAAARNLAEAAELDNRSYEAVSQFERHRIKVSELWSKLGSAENALAEARNRLENANKTPAAKREQGDIQTQVKRLEKDAKREREAYEKEAARKNRLWEEVELMWNRSLEINLTVAEKKRKGARVRTAAEKLFRAAEDNKIKTESLAAGVKQAQDDKKNLEKAIREQYDRARQQFNCLIEEDFLYWPQRENNRMVYCVPLLDDREAYNIEIKSLHLYQTERQKGVEFLEPLSLTPKGGDAGDTRLEAFFNAGRK